MQREFFAVVGIVTLLGLGCEKSPDSEQAGTAAQTAGAPAADQTIGQTGGATNGTGLDGDATVETRPFPAELPPEFEASDTLPNGVSWGDRNGDNILFFEKTHLDLPSKGRTTTIRVRYFTRSPVDNKWVSRRDERRAVDHCKSETVAEVITGDWSVADVEPDGMGDVTYALRMGCRSDKSPVEHRVQLLNRTQQWEMSGESLVTSGDGEKGGAVTSDSFGQEPKFKAQAEKIWAATVREP